MRLELKPSVKKMIQRHIDKMNTSWGSDFVGRILPGMRPISSERGIQGPDDPYGWSTRLTQHLSPVAEMTSQSLDDALWLLRHVMQRRFDVGERKRPISSIDWVDARASRQVLEKYTTDHLREVFEQGNVHMNGIIDAELETIRAQRDKDNSKRRKESMADQEV